MNDLAELLFPEITQTPEDIFKKYPARETWKNVTRIAPSPTGFLHIWAVYSTLVDQFVASRNNGIFFLRIEDTDQKRELEWAAKMYVNILKKIWLEFQEWPIWENGEDVWNYGPYTQSKRADIYKVFIKDWIRQAKAYPCFMSEEEITDVRAIQEASKVPTGIYGEFSPWRNATYEQVQEAINAWKKFIIRFASNGSIHQKIEVEDLIKGNITIGENFNDIVIMKSDGIPTYHFAHLVDDHLMGTTHVIRGDEWFASLPLHFQLFDTMGWQRPLYAHYWPLVKIEGEAKRKLSKRKDPEADVNYYFSEWFLPIAILEFLANLANAWFEEWRKQNPEKHYLEFDFKLEKMSSSGALVDLQKLTFVNSNVINTLSLEKLYEKIEQYLQEFDKDFYENIFVKANREKNEKIISELQKRLTKLSEYKSLTTFFYQDFEVTQKIVDMLVNPKMKIEDLQMAKAWLELTLEILKNKTEEFESVEEVKNIFVEEIAKAQMKNGQVLWPVRVALSGEEFSPWALELIYLLKKEKSIQRLQNILNFLG